MKEERMMMMIIILIIIIMIIIVLTLNIVTLMFLNMYPRKLGFKINQNSVIQIGKDLLFIHSFIRSSAVCLKTGPQPLSKRVLHKVQSSTSSFNFQYLNQ